MHIELYLHTGYKIHDIHSCMHTVKCSHFIFQKDLYG